MNDLELITRLSKETGKKLKQRTFEELEWYNGYSLDENGNVNSLNLGNLNLERLPQSLSKFRYLRILRLRDNQLTDISGLQGLSSLTTLYLYNNLFSDISPLKELHNLTTLDLSVNRLNDVTPLQGLRNLKTLDLSVNQLTNIEGLQGLSNLTELNLNSNRLNDIEPLQGMSNIDTLTLRHNKIKELPGWIAGMNMKTDMDSISTSSRSVY
ncbi:MAG: hypothetical protein GY940_38370 [bacterium]|nr:hypothetical protein [bacterium]